MNSGVYKNVIALIGPTSSGKTKSAISLCKEFDGIILSFDSRQLVKYLTIGTSKQPIGSSCKAFENYWEVDGVKVYGYDLIEPGQYFSAADYKNYALSVISENPKKNIFLVGGTGFYLDVLMGKVTTNFAPPNQIVRSALSIKTTQELLDMLKEFNSALFEKVDKSNRQRIIRYVEASTQSFNITENISDNQLKSISPAKVLGLKTPREVLYLRANDWVDKVWIMGLVEEAKQAVDKYGINIHTNGIIYKQVLDFLNQVETKESAIQKSKYAIHAYIRRQETYFKRMTDILWIDTCDLEFSKNLTNIVKSIL